MPAGELEWSAVHRLFLGTWLGNNKRGPFEPVLLTDEDLRGLEPADPDLQLPPTIPLLFSRAAGFTILDSAGGASATALAGRFSLFSPELDTLCSGIAEAEAAANPGVAFAGIHQRSHAHVDNINRRRPVYQYNIPVNVFPGPRPGRAAIPRRPARFRAAGYHPARIRQPGKAGHPAFAYRL
jgi:hypothetical protein